MRLSSKHVKQAVDRLAHSFAPSAALASSFEPSCDVPTGFCCTQAESCSGTYNGHCPGQLNAAKTQRGQLGVGSTYSSYCCGFGCPRRTSAAAGAAVVFMEHRLKRRRANCGTEVRTQVEGAGSAQKRKAGKRAALVHRDCATMMSPLHIPGTGRLQAAKHGGNSYNAN